MGRPQVEQQHNRASQRNATQCEQRSAPRAGQPLRVLACLRHALHDRLGIQCCLALPPLVVASRRMLGHGQRRSGGSSQAAKVSRAGSRRIFRCPMRRPGSSEPSAAVPACGGSI